MGGIENGNFTTTCYPSERCLPSAMINHEEDKSNLTMGEIVICRKKDGSA
jgi:hypothetical protein